MNKNCNINYNFHPTPSTSTNNKTQKLSNVYFFQKNFLKLITIEIILLKLLTLLM